MSMFFIGIFFQNSNVMASELPNNDDIQLNKNFEDDDYYYIFEQETPTLRTWSQAQNYTITKGSRTYLGRFNLGHSVTVTVPIPHGGGSKVEYKYSRSGYFKEYRQNCTIKVTVKIYRKVDNKYVGTKTYTSNTSYVDRIPD